MSMLCLKRKDVKMQAINIFKQSNTNGIRTIKKQNG